MKKNKKLQLNMIGILVISCLFLLSLFVPEVQIFAKIGALLTYAIISYRQISEQKKQGEDVEKASLFAVVVIIALGYLFFFT